MNAKTTLLLLAMAGPAFLQAAGYQEPRSVSSIGSAGEALNDQKARLHEANLKQHLLGKEAEKMLDDFENLALEAIHADEALLQEIWDSAEKSFRLEPNRAEDVRDAVEYYIEIFNRSKKLSEQQTALDALGGKEKGNKAKNKAIKETEKRIKKNRKKITVLQKKIKKALKSAIEYDEDGEQRQRLDNWVAVSTGILQDEAANKASAEAALPAKGEGEIQEVQEP